MKTQRPYDPEDIESLMLHKRFDELYPEEKNFVLQHLDSPEEYEHLRHMLHEVKRSYRQDGWLEPDASIKKNLMAHYASEKKGKFRIWLNQLFAIPERPWYAQPALRYALGGAAVIVAATWWLSTNDQPKMLAENKPKPHDTIEVPAALPPAANKSAMDSMHTGEPMDLKPGTSVITHTLADEQPSAASKSEETKDLQHLHSMDAPTENRNEEAHTFEWKAGDARTADVPKSREAATDASTALIAPTASTTPAAKSISSLNEKAEAKKNVTAGVADDNLDKESTPAASAAQVADLLELVFTAL